MRQILSGLLGMAQTSQIIGYDGYDYIHMPRVTLGNHLATETVAYGYRASCVHWRASTLAVPLL